MKNGLEMYEDVEITSKVMAASAVGLIELLFEKCLQQTEVLSECVKTDNVAGKHKAVNNVKHIIRYLRNCLNISDPTTRDVAMSLDQFYNALEVELFQVSINPRPEHIARLHGLIQQVASAWGTIEHV